MSDAAYSKLRFDGFGGLLKIQSKPKSVLSSRLLIVWYRVVTKRLSIAWPACFFMFLSVSMNATEQTLEAKCGDCHSVSSEIDRSEFDDLLASYNWANWSSVPLRVWISNHHKPRIPSINISESEAAKINAHIADLKSQNKFGDVNSSGSDAFFADATVAEPSGYKSVEVETSDGVKLEQQSEGDAEEITVDFSECLNCQ